MDKPLVVVADDMPEIQDLICDTLEILEAVPEFRRVGSIDELLRTVYLQEVALITLDINFEDAGSANREGLDALPRLIQTKPRVPIIVVSGQVDQRRIREAMRDREQVRAVLDKDIPDFLEELAAEAEQAIAWGRAQRLRADALFEQAEAAMADERHVDAARLFVEAYRTGDLSGPNRRAIKEKLGPLLPRLIELPDLRFDAFRALLEHCFDTNDELGLIFYARGFEEAFPHRKADAHEYLALSAEIGNRLYEMVDERLGLISLHQERGDFSQVLRECHLIQEKLGNVLPSFLHEAEAYRALGRYQEAVQSYFTAADMSVRNGEVDRARTVLQTIAHVDIEKGYQWKIDEFEQLIDDIHQRVTQIDSFMIPTQYLRICGDPACRESALAAGSFFRIDTALPIGACDVCGIEYQVAEQRITGKTITIIGGRFGPRYREAILAMGAREVLHHDAIDEVQRIPGYIEAADGVLIVTGYASHAGTIKAERELVRMPRPCARVHFYGVRQVLRGLVLELLPRMKVAA
jgi:CheY-like chemotaxis protein